MLKEVNNFNFYNLGEVPLNGVNLTAKQYYNDAINDAIYGSDDFRMFGYKIKRCTKLQAHDWNDCPYAHRGERAQRRDPRKVSYSAILCRSYRTGNCPKGNSCEHSHGLFEYWLHPDRYRTRPCNAGMFCQRKVCFFAHTAEQLRSEPRLWCNFVYPGTTSGGDRQYQQQYYQYNHDVVKSSGSSDGGHGKSVTAATSGIIPAESSPSSVATRGWPEYRYEEVEKVLKSLRGLETSDIGGHKKEPVKTNNIRGSGSGIEVSNPYPDLDLPHFEWIADLVQ